MKRGPFRHGGNFTGTLPKLERLGEAGRLAENAVFQDWVRAREDSDYFRLVFA